MSYYELFDIIKDISNIFTGKRDYELGYKDGEVFGSIKAVEHCMAERSPFNRKNIKSINNKEKYIEGFQKAINDLKVEREDHYTTNKHRYALTCRKCGEDALPVAGTERHYSCSSCGNKFTGAKHPF